MSIETIIKLKENSLYIDYIHKNSYWYKTLNRNPNSFEEFKENVKIYYGLRPIDKVSKLINNMEMVENVLNALK